MSKLLADAPSSDNPAGPTSNPAIENCIQAYLLAKKASLAKGSSDYASHLDGADAYRLAMPLLLSRQQITSFIACTAHAMLMKVISSDEAARFLQAAQVAGRALQNAAAKPEK